MSITGGFNFGSPPEEDENARALLTNEEILLRGICTAAVLRKIERVARQKEVIDTDRVPLK